MELGKAYTQEVIIGERLRSVDAARVNSLAESMAAIGLQQPISVWIDDDERPVLVAGRHRLAAAAKLGWEEIDCIYVALDEVDRRLWEIAENLHRAELTVLERDQHIAEWVRLTDEKVRQVGAPVGGAQPREEGKRKAAKELGVKEQAVRRAVQVDKLAPEAKAEAKAQGLDDNQSALLAAAKHASKEDQIAALRQRAAEKAERKPVAPPPSVPLNDMEISNKTRRRLASAWDSAPPADREWFREWIDTPAAKWNPDKAA